MYLRNDDGCYIHESQFQQYIPEFTLKNLKKTYQIKLGNIWAARKMPDVIKCYSKEWEWYKVPAGISGYLPSKFHTVYDNKVIEHPALSRVSYDYQLKAVWELTSRSVWLLHASTGSGKTQMICDITHRLKRNTLIVVQNLTQMAQMVDDIYKILWVIPTQISGKKVGAKVQTTWYEYITVCSIDSRDKVNPSDYWLILLDEADCYLWSDDRREWVGSLSPEYLYALTWTIKINHVDDKVFKLYYWPTTTLKLHHLTPDYVQVPTQFEYILDDMKDFHELKEALYSSEERNSIVLDLVTNRCKGRKWIVFCEYIEHARYIHDNLQRRGIKSFLLIWEVAKEDREKIRKEAAEYKWDVCLVGSVKILWRWFDLPELSYGILTTCEKFQSNILQYVGRIIRSHNEKLSPVFYDLVDQFQYMLNNQAKSRISTYKKTFPDGKTFIL